MKGLLRKFDLSALLGKIKLVPGKIAGMSGATKSTIIKVVAGLGLTGVVIAGAAPSLNDNTDAVLPPKVENTQDQDATGADDSQTADDKTDDQQVDDDANKLNFSFLSDELKITDIDMESVLGERVESEVATAAEGMEPVAGVGVDESGKPLSKEEINKTEEKIDGNYFIAPDGTPWVSEEEYNKYVAGQNSDSQTVVETDKTTTTGASYYVAPDGSFWESEAAYQEYVKGLDGTQVAPSAPQTGTGEQDNNSGYLAPDGSYWESEAAYQEYINTQNNSQNPTNPQTGTGNQENNDGSYLAPDGTYWDSEQDYLDYINQGQNSDTSNYFVAPDGSYWDSEEEYNNYISGLNNTQAASSNPQTGAGEQESTSGYLAPDGTYWASESDYNDYINSLNSSNSNENNNNNQDTNVNQNTNEENNNNENTSSDYFVAPDGSVWASESDYNDYMNSLTNESGKTK